MQLCCPSCFGSLSDELTCSSCGARYPTLGAVPVLVSDAKATMQRWRLRAREFVAGVSRGVTAARTELKREDLLVSTRGRITRSCDALEDNRARILSLLEESGIRPAAEGEVELVTEEPSSPAGRGGLTEYYEQIHRDWGWPEADAENRIALERVREAVGGARDLGVVAVLGAGAGRLAYDVHREWAPRATVALDINPLLLVVAARIARGETVSLIEFPLIPRDIDHVTVIRELCAPHGAVASFHPIVADAFRPPLAAGSIDTVLTPWFIDQVPADARDAIGAVHRLLAPGGRWINFGPLIYPKDRAYGVRYTASELLELIARSGFEVERSRLDMTEFLRSPAAGFARVEQVLTFAATKTERLDDDEPPQWLVAPHLPIPRFAGLDDYRAPHPLLGHVAAMIDGATSLTVIIERVVSEHGIPPSVAKLGVPAAAAEIARACGPCEE